MKYVTLFFLAVGFVALVALLMSGKIKLPKIGNPFGWIKLPKWTSTKWPGVVLAWLISPVPLAFISAHVIMGLNPVSRDFMMALMGKDWEDPSRFFFIAGEIWFVFVLYRLFKTSWAKYFIAIIPGIPLVIGFHLFASAFFPQYNAFVEKTAATLESIPMPRWSPKEAGMPAGTTSATRRARAREMRFEDIDYHPDCGRPDGPDECRGSVNTLELSESEYSMKWARAPEEQAVWRPWNSSICWGVPRGVTHWRGPS